MIDVPNLDCMGEASLAQFAAENLSHSSLIMRNAAAYAVCKLGAMRSRLSGRIDNALRLEAKCDRIYAMLPLEHQW